MTVRAVGDKFVVSGDYAERGAAPVMAEFRSVPGAGNYWIVVGPRVLRGGRVDPRQRVHYGTVREDGRINNYGGSGAAGRHHRTYLEIARDKLAGQLGGVGHVVAGPEPAPAPEPPPPGTGGVITIVDKPAVRGVTIRRLEAAGIRCQVERSPIAGTVILHVDAERGREAWRISRDVEREWLDAKHGRGGKRRAARDVGALADAVRKLTR